MSEQTLKAIVHGTNRGYYQELRRKLPTCQACRDAHNGLRDDATVEIPEPKPYVVPEEPKKPARLRSSSEGLTRRA